MSLSPPKIKPTAAAPPPMDMTPAQQELGGDNQKTMELARKRKGRSALRIDLQHGGSGLSAGGSGVNIPQK